MPLLADTHCHLNFSAFQADLQEVINRARAAGVQRFMIPGADIETSRSAIEYSDEYEFFFAAAGIHPNESAGWTGAEINELRRLAGCSNTLAIGEIGLDFYRQRSPRELQIEVFTSQLNLAAEIGKPVIIHCREAEEETRKILFDWHSHLDKIAPLLSGCPGVLHSFAGSLEFGKEAVQRGFYIGVGGPITFTNAPKLRETISSLPVEHLVIETDAPYLTPHPHRSKRNEPAYCTQIAAAMGDLFGYSLEKMALITYQNASKLFKWERSE